MWYNISEYKQRNAEKGMLKVKKTAIIYGEYATGIQKKAVEVLSSFILEYTFEYPVCFRYGDAPDLSGFRCIYIGTKENNGYIAQNSTAALRHAEEYHIRVHCDSAIIEGSDDAGVLYGCVDFYNRFIVKSEELNADHCWINPFDKEWQDFEATSHPAIRQRGIWTWGHVIYDWKGFVDNLVKLKLNTVVVWNDHPPVNAADMVAYAHACNVKVIWGYAWFWDTHCAEIDIEAAYASSAAILEQYEREYLPLGGDGIYFQSFTELHTETIGGKLIAEAVTEFVNKTAAGFFEKYPDIELQFGLHATSVKERLSYIANVDPRVRIVWEDCGAFPFSYLPNDVQTFDDTCDFVNRIAVLRGNDDRFGAVTKGLTKLDWSQFEHVQGPVFIGGGSDRFKENRIIRKRRIWRYLQAYWLTNADKAYEMTRLMQKRKDGDLYITALIEDGMFEEKIMYPAALYAEMLWDCSSDIRQIMSQVALRSYVEFA